jgi:hypothetical protein
VRSVVEFASTEHVEKEGLPAEEGRVTGAPVEQLEFRERGFEFRLPLAAAQKTGFYFDQRENRARLETLCAGKRVLDACSYVGAFSLAAARGGAREVIALIGTGLSALDTEGAPYKRPFGEPAEVGRMFLTNYLVAFEAASLLLLVAAVGAVILARRRSGLADVREISVGDMLSGPDLTKGEGDVGTLLEAGGPPKI